MVLIYFSLECTDNTWDAGFPSLSLQGFYFTVIFSLPPSRITIYSPGVSVRSISGSELNSPTGFPSGVETLSVPLCAASPSSISAIPDSPPSKLKLNGRARRLSNTEYFSTYEAFGFTVYSRFSPVAITSKSLSASNRLALVSLSAGFSRVVSFSVLPIRSGAVMR